jgi:hypothetical protein
MKLFALLEMLSEVPQCALECFTGTIMKTDCALTDFYCQCGKNADFIQKTTLECLCTSECTTSDLASTLPPSSIPPHKRNEKRPSANKFFQTEVYSISNELCTKTLADHGETYNMPPDTLATGICHSSDAPAEASSTASAVSAATTGSSSSSNSTGTSTNGTTSSSPKASGADFEGAAASSFGMSVAAIALGAVAFMI